MIGIGSGVLATVILVEHLPDGPQTLAIVGDRRLSVAALTALLLKNPAYHRVLEAHGIDDIRVALLSHRPGVVIVDSSVAAFSSIDPAAWGGRMLLLLDPEDDSAIFTQAVRAGAHGYLSRSVPRQSLEEAVAALRKSGFYLDPLLVGRILPVMRLARASRAALSPREREILIRIASGRSTKEVAREYAITPKTVGNHVNNIYQKLNLRHRGELVLYAAQQGLTTLTCL